MKNKNNSKIVKLTSCNNGNYELSSKCAHINENGCFFHHSAALDNISVRFTVLHYSTRTLLGNKNLCIR